LTSNDDATIVRDPDVEIHRSSTTVHCECGEDTPGEIAGHVDDAIECPCGRNWRVTATLERLSGPEPTPFAEGGSSA